MLRPETLDLIRNEDADPLECRRHVVEDFNTATGQAWASDELTEDQTHELVVWLRERHLNEDFPYVKRSLASSYFDGLESKVSWHTQRPCGSCRTEFPVLVTPVRYRAFSAQNVEGRVARAFRKAFAARHAAHVPLIGPICVRLVFVLDPRRPTRLDVDNLAKGVLDAAKHVLFGDDSDVEHLEVLKFRSYSNDHDHFLIRLAPTQVGSLNNVLRRHYQAEFGVSQLVDLDPYLAEETE